MNTLYLHPTDVLFFRDGRPMSGSLSGHGAAWPLPTVTNAALHAALHRADIEGAHGHDHHRQNGERINDARKFGSLVTAGPFPVRKQDEHGKEIPAQWFFPRPLDAGASNSTEITFLPLNIGLNTSSLPKPLKYPVANTEPPSKDTPAPWWSRSAFSAYLENPSTPSPEFLKDSDFSDTESTYGIGIDDNTGTQDGESFYSAHYLRLRDQWRLGLLAEAQDKIDNNVSNKRDLIQHVFPNSGAQTGIIAGGQQRICTVERPCGETIQLPVGKTDGFTEKNGKHLVKWILLSPAVFPEIKAGISKRGTERKAHSGGWLPTWICPQSGEVLLESISSEERKRRRSLNAAGKGYASHPNINAILVSAIIGKPIPVTGYALANEADPDRKAGAKSTHLAVPAGSVYYFECDPGPENDLELHARNLAAALNWHGAEASQPSTPDSPHIRNRRSTLFGEKGFGLGVCGAWDFHDGNRPA